LNSSVSIENNKNSSEKKLFGGVFVLTISTVIVKVTGLLFKIPLIHYVGIEGMAYFLAAYHIYTLLFVISSTGLPVAVSILVSEYSAKRNFATAESVFKISLLIFVLLGAAGSTVMFFGAYELAQAIGMPDAYYSIRAIAPTLTFVCVSSAVRGYFQGKQSMMPTAVSQMLESFGKLVMGLLFALYALNMGYEPCICASYAIFGITAGVALSMIYLVFCRLFRHHTIDDNISKKEIRAKSIFKRLILLAAPITISASIISFSSAVDTALISNRLQNIGFTEQIASSLYSCYGNLAVPIYTLPLSFITPITLALIPMLTSAVGTGDVLRAKKLYSSAIRLTASVAIPASFGICVFAYSILHLIYPSQIEGITTAAPLLAVLATSVFPSALISITTAVLQAYKKVSLPIISMFAGSLIKVVLAYTLVGTQFFNIYGAPLSTLACNIIIVTLNLYFINKYTGNNEDVTQYFYRPLFCTAISVGVSALIYVCLFCSTRNENICLLTAIIVTVILYGILSLSMGALGKEDILLLPGGKKIFKTLHKLKLVKN